MSTNKSIAKSAGIIGSATLVSRILGFMRDIIFAAFFGTGIYAQAFVVAFRIPNLFRDLIGEGAANAAVVPVLVEELTHKGKAEFWKLANILLNLILVIVTLITLAGVLLSKPIVIAIAPGFLQDAAKLNVTVALTRTIFPYLIFIGLAAYSMGALNSIRHFTAPAFSMSLLNVSLILCMFIWRQDVIGLGIGVLFGGFLQIAVQVPVLLKNGMTFNQKRFMHPKIRKILKLLVPRIFGSGVYQINVFISTVLASIARIAGEGAVAALYFSNRIMQFPLAIFAIALAQASLPVLSSHFAKKDYESFKKTINFLLRSVFFVLLPASAGLLALSAPITSALFKRGAFGDYSTLITSNALFFYSFGLLFYGAIKILVNAFYALQDTRTPVKVASVSLFVNISLSILLMFKLKAGGLALANSISGALNALLLFIILRKRLKTLYEKGLVVSLLKISTASLLMGIFVFRLNGYLKIYLSPEKTLYCAINILISIVAAVLFYLITCHILRIRELKELMSWVLKRK